MGTKLLLTGLLLAALFSFKEKQTSQEYKISYFIQGRLSEAEVHKSMPFTVRVIYLNKSLFEQKMNLTIVDLKHYQIAYTEDSLIQYQYGNFGSELRNTDMALRISGTSGLSDSSIKTLKDIPYQFVVHAPAN
jgi:hypothetical protein